MAFRLEWDSPRPPPPPPPEPKRGGHTRLRVKGWGSPNSDGLEKKLSTLSTLWVTIFTDLK